MTPNSESPWVVLKFGGSSVSTVPNWHNIAGVVRQRLADNTRVMVVHSALTGVTDRLEKLLVAALGGAHEPVLKQIEDKHRALADEMGVGVSPQLDGYFAVLRQISAGIALMTEVSDRTRARVMASGELMSTEIGARFLKSQGIDAFWWDAREGLRAETHALWSARQNFLSATCDFARDPVMRAKLDARPGVVITQGFIAGDAAGDTVLLGRGGSDTSAAYFAAKLGARRLEIWTDVPGMFSANPRHTPQARLLKSLHYDEAQEIASSGAKVLHPRCILPAKSQRIPIVVYDTQHTQLEGTHISADGGDGIAQVKAVCLKKGITLVTLDSPGMWHQVGFLADAFQIFKQHGLSIDLVSTSETNVTVSLDPAANTLGAAVLEKLSADLTELGRVQVIGPCASVSLVGRNIRAILHQLGEAFVLFSDQRIYLLSQAANDLNFTFVVDEDQGDRLVGDLHERLIEPVRQGSILGPTWQQLFAPPAAPRSAASSWWRAKRDRLLALAETHESAYVYDLQVVREAAQRLRSLKSVDRVLYAMKANPNPAILQLLAAEGVDFDCVSRGEVEHLLANVPGLSTDRILFTPNFAPRAEYEWALQRGILLTVDNLFVLREWGELLRGRSVLLRVDTGVGRGHHHYVHTAGAHSKFGIPMAQLDEAVRLVARFDVSVVGLHAHSGSGIFDADNWSEVADCLLKLRSHFPHLRTIDVGGGLGVADAQDPSGLDLDELDKVLAQAREADPGLSLWIEPGRYLVASAGALIARVTQTKSKDDVHYVGVGTGMNSLIRPALYGAWHEIVNLTRLDEKPSETVNIVGPICESGDFLGHERLMPPSREGDVLLIANAGAYGRAMSSHYCLREPAVEIVI
ncbi:MAG TPA: bifunctional aspartate kinase/diaminopimelate decarboxylase [Steroidobacteraceae bacterium]|jgi:diaminopimelate decarboxylase/aspartate kinase|nr:bifunctional aspartate kinase/diaminopimelate decarboxylase [Steroidobacteraceae bacterium]